MAPLTEHARKLTKLDGILNAQQAVRDSLHAEAELIRENMTRLRQEIDELEKQFDEGAERHDASLAITASVEQEIKVSLKLLSRSVK